MRCLVRGDDPDTGSFPYEKLVADVLNKHHCTKFVILKDSDYKFLRFKKAKNLVYNKLHRFRFDTVISSPNQYALGLNPTHFSASVLVVHHLDYGSRIQRHVYDSLKKKSGQFTKFVTVSRFWKSKLESFYPGTNFEVIYNSFDISLFNQPTTTVEMRRFLSDYDLATDKKIIYLGQPRKGKGLEKVIRTLQGNSNLLLISTGYGTPLAGARNIYFESYRDYLKFLSACSCAIFLPDYDEGWCRSAHESILSRVPVIGCRSGGMTELLNLCDQQIIDDVAELPDALDRVLSRGQVEDAVAERLHAFDLNYFEQAWLNLVNAC